jgi:hypothetical protein
MARVARERRRACIAGAGGGRGKEGISTGEKERMEILGEKKKALLKRADERQVAEQMVTRWTKARNSDPEEPCQAIYPFSVLRR